MALIFKDLFTEPTADTVLTSHTPDTGVGYTEEANNSTFVVNALTVSGHAKASGVKGSREIAYSMQPDPTNAEYDVEVVQAAVDTTGVDDPVILGSRWINTTNKYGLSIRRSAVNTAVYEIFKWTTALGSVSLASASTPLANGDDSKFETRDATKKGFKNGVEIVSTTDNDSDLLAPGKSFIGWGDIFQGGKDVESLWELDNLRVTEVSSGGGPTITLPQIERHYPRALSRGLCRGLA